MTTTAQAFDKFVGQISPTPVQSAAIKEKRTTTESYLRAAFPASTRLPCNASSLSDQLREEH